MIFNIAAGDPLEKIKPTPQVAPTGPSYTEHIDDAEHEEHEEHEEREYRVRVTRYVTILEESYAYIHARSADEAEERVNDDIYHYCDEWEFCDILNSYNEEVNEVEEV
jgi:hypothetical protein